MTSRATHRTARRETFLAGAFMLGMLVHVPGLGLVPISAVAASLIAVPILSTASLSIRRLAAWSGVAIATGLLTLWGSLAVSGTPIPSFQSWGSIVLWLAAIPLLPALAEWSLKRIALRTGVLLMLTGAIVTLLLTQGLEWKGTLGIYVSAFVLVLVARHALLSLSALIAITTASFANDARSMALVALVTLVAAVVMRERRTSSKTSVIWLILAVTCTVAIAIGVFVSGLAGQQVQQRTVDQLNRPNFIFGVRAEWASTTSLFLSQPMGYGTGAQPSPSQTSEAIQAVQRAGGDWTSRYFSDVVFGERVDLHSILANLWFHFGVVGIVVAVLVGVILLRGIRDAALSQNPLGLGGIFLMLMASWDLLFSPMANVDRLIAGIIVASAIAAMSKRSHRQGQGRGNQERESQYHLEPRRGW